MSGRDPHNPGSGSYRFTPRPGTSSNVPVTLVPVLPEHGGAPAHAQASTREGGANAQANLAGPHTISAADFPTAHAPVLQATPGTPHRFGSAQAGGAQFGTMMVSAMSTAQPANSSSEELGKESETWFEAKELDSELELDTSAQASTSGRHRDPFRRGSASIAASLAEGGALETAVPLRQPMVSGSLSGARSGMQRAPSTSVSFGTPAANTPPSPRGINKTLALGFGVSVLVIVATLAVLSQTGADDAQGGNADAESASTATD